MFNRLLESNPKRQRRLGGIVASTIFHTVLIALAVRATQLTATPAPPKVDDIVAIYQPPRPPEQTASPTTVRRASSRTAQTLLPSVFELKPITPVDVMVPGIPEPRTTGPITTSRDFDATFPGGRGPDGEAPPNVKPGEPFTAGIVDKVIIAIPGTGNPRYPATLQSAGLEGDVRAQFVVDTLGRVERGSVRVLDSTHELFAAAVRDALTRAKFKPAEAGGHRVRQLAEQMFTFRIAR